jgi:hypothetical protein
MKAIIVGFNRSLGNYRARTENDIPLSFSIADGTDLKLNEELEVDLPNLARLQSLVRLSDAKIIKIKIGRHDLHDLRLPVGHGTTRTPAPERLNGA